MPEENADKKGIKSGPISSINSVIRRPPKIHRRNKAKKVPYFQWKIKAAQRRIIQKPWSRPMAAQHLAAIRIQGAIRKFLYRKAI